MMFGKFIGSLNTFFFSIIMKWSPINFCSYSWVKKTFQIYTNLNRRQSAVLRLVVIKEFMKIYFCGLAAINGNEFNFFFYFFLFAKFWIEVISVISIRLTLINDWSFLWGEGTFILSLLTTLCWLEASNAKKKKKTNRHYTVVFFTTTKLLYFVVLIALNFI